MAPKTILVLLFAALASCGARDDGNGVNGGSAVTEARLPKLSLASDAFSDGGQIPAQYTCDGAERTPVLHWGEPPAGTRSFALVIDDPDAPGGTFRHWGVYDIPASARSIGEQRIGSEVRNDFGKPGYSGPCPPQGHGPHHYHFRLFALKIDRLGIGEGAKVADVEHAAEQHAIAQDDLVGTFERH